MRHHHGTTARKASSLAAAPRSTALRTIAGGLRRLASQGDHDFAVDDLDVTDTNFSGGLESGFERRPASPPTQCGAPSAITRFSAFRWSTTHMLRAHKARAYRQMLLLANPRDDALY
jgi:hypothetical protein